MSIDDLINPASFGARYARTPTLPVAGFWLRLGAFVVDWLILYCFLYGLARIARTPLLALGAWAPAISTLGMFLYFWFGNGPFGKGKTLGKAIVGLRVIAAEDGRPLDWRRSLIRTAILFPPNLWTNYLILSWALPENPSLTQTWIATSLRENLWAALYLAQIIYVTLNPTRQGFHDTLSHSLVLTKENSDVVWETLERLLFQSLQEEEDEEEQREGEEKDDEEQVLKTETADAGAVC